MSESARGRRGEARWRGKTEEGVKMGMHANFIILLINFSSSNPPAGTCEQIGDGERLMKSRLILNSHPQQNSVFYSILALSTFSLASVMAVFWQYGCLLSLLTKREGLVRVSGHLHRNKLGLCTHISHIKSITSQSNHCFYNSFNTKASVACTHDHAVTPDYTRHLTLV